MDKAATLCPSRACHGARCLSRRTSVCSHPRAEGEGTMFACAHVLRVSAAILVPASASQGSTKLFTAVYLVVLIATSIEKVHHLAAAELRERLLYSSLLEFRQPMIELYAVGHLAHGCHAHVGIRTCS